MQTHAKFTNTQKLTLIPLSEIGKIQLIDVERSNRYHDDYARVCRVIRSKNWHGDKSPLRLSKLFGKPWREYDTHFVVQVAGCPLNCKYCYVDNLESDKDFSAGELVTKFLQFRKIQQNLNVIHLCGGDPARYPEFWYSLRHVLDRSGLTDVVILSDVIFLENFYYNKQPWKYLDKIENFALSGCLKGTTPKNFLENSGKDLFDVAFKEFTKYVEFDNFWLSLIEYDVSGLPTIFDLLPLDRIDFLNVVNYEVVKWRNNE
jgi:uncharacterized Fe-S cluster-containing radical SAM superfamily protein